MRKIALITLAAWVTGCALTPDYKRPSEAIANNPTEIGQLQNNARLQANVNYAQWWKLYNDATLDDLVDRSLSANTDMRVALANLERAAASISVTTDAEYPQVGVAAEAAFSRDSAEQFYLPGPLPNEKVYAALGSVSYEVDLFGRVRRSVEASKAEMNVSKDTVAATRIAVVAQTVSAYLAVCASGRESIVTQHAIALQEEETKLVKRFQDSGRSGSLAVTRSTSQEDSLRASLPPLSAAKEIAMSRLALILALPRSAIPASVAGCVDEPQIAQLIPVGDGRSLLARRPDVAAAEERLHAATAEYGVVKADLYPSISFGVSGGSIGALGHFNDDDTYKFSLGPLVSWQFPNRRRAKAELTQSQAQIDAAYARFDASVLAALNEVQTSLSAYGYDLDRMNHLKTARRSSSKASVDARKLFGLGRENYLSVLDADRQLASLDQTIAAQQTKLANDQVQLFLTLGGGWQ